MLIRKRLLVIVRGEGFSFLGETRKVEDSLIHCIKNQVHACKEAQIGVFFIFLKSSNFGIKDHYLTD